MIQYIFLLIINTSFNYIFQLHLLLNILFNSTKNKYIESKSFFQILTDQPGKDAWPITGATFILMQKVQDKPAQATAVLKFFEWAYKTGDKAAEELDYVPMPADVKVAIEKSWAEIKDAAGKPIAFR